MLEDEKSSAMTLGIAADTPVQGGMADQGVIPLASAGAIVKGHALLRSVRLEVARLSQADMPQLPVS
jgi:hypothetical protein